MKSYPSIPRCTGTMFFEMPNAFIFDKLDGNNIRAKWTKKQGWHMFGTKNTVFNHTDPIFGNTIKIFNDIGLADQIAEIAINNKWREIVAFMEYYGPNSFAGRHNDADAKTLTLFDVSIHKQGMLGPKQFLQLFKYLQIPKFLGNYNWTRGFIEKVFNNEIDGVTFEGVVGKAGEGHKLVMSKAKTKIWLDKVMAMHSAEQAETIINS